MARTVGKHLNNPNAYVLLEGSQGCDLCLNHSGNYPSTTHKNISSSQMIADSGISFRCITNYYGY